jgi:hypothetical protein
MLVNFIGGGNHGTQKKPPTRVIVLVFIFQASKKAGISDEIAKHALSKIKDDDVKNRLKKNTEEALKLGVSVVNPNRVYELGGFVRMFL